MCCLAFFVNFKSRQLIISCWIDEFSCETLEEAPVKSYPACCWGLKDRWIIAGDSSLLY
jgi:hypothetical protein